MRGAGLGAGTSTNQAPAEAVKQGAGGVSGGGRHPAPGARRSQLAPGGCKEYMPMAPCQAVERESGEFKGRGLSSSSPAAAGRV